MGTRFCFCVFKSRPTLWKAKIHISRDGFYLISFSGKSTYSIYFEEKILCVLLLFEKGKDPTTTTITQTRRLNILQNQANFVCLKLGNFHEKKIIKRLQT